MKIEKRKEFIADLAELAKKHGVTVVSGTQASIKKFATSVEGFNLFFTDNVPNLLKGGESIKFEASKIVKVKRKHEDDGN